MSTVKKDRDYVVEVPYRGVEIHLVSARSKAEAMRKVKEGEEHTMVDYRTTVRFDPSGAWIDEVQEKKQP